MSKRYRITLSEYWAEWAEGEATHRCQTMSELMEDALSAFQDERVTACNDRTAEAYRGWERRRRMKETIRAKLTPAQREFLHL